MPQVLDLAAYREWQSWPEERRQMYLNNAFCAACLACGKGAEASFAPGYIVSRYAYGLMIEGNCARCGNRIARCCG